LEGKYGVDRLESNYNKFLFSLCVTLGIVLIFRENAWAHAETGLAAGFFSGVKHPISGLDHVFAMIAVGIWGAQLGRPAIYVLPVTFPMVMAFGGMLGLMGMPLPGVEICIALSAFLLGLMVVGEVRPHLALAAIIVGFFAIFHGHAHGTELPEEQSGLHYSIGFVMATGCLHGLGILIGTVHRWKQGRIILRMAGAVISLGGILFLWRSIF
jgi:urease accessory protein